MPELSRSRSLSRLALLCAAATFAPGSWAAPAAATKAPAKASAASAPAGSANVPLRDTTWVLQTLGGTAVATNDARPVQITLRSKSQHLNGFAGCNTLRGRYTQRGTTIALKPIATTRMACAPEVMEQETRLLQAMASAESYRVEGRKLSLLQADGVTVTFSATKAR
ncbi:MAG: META domain-containing protein [Rhizobacter sp.]